MDWYRVYHGMPEDAKLKVIAKRSQQTMAHVVTVWLCVLDAASRHKNRGTVEVDSEQIAVVQDMDQAAVESILQAFREKGMITEDNRITSWNTRQYLSDKERAQRARDKKKQDVTENHTASHSVTEGNAAKRKIGKKAPDTDNRLQKADSETDLQKNRITDKKNRESAEGEREREARNAPPEKDADKIAEQMLQIWNAEVQSKLTKGQKAKLTPKRKAQMLERWQQDFQQDMRSWRYFCDIISRSDFCLGKLEGKGWTIDLSWAVASSDHVAKIMEGGFSGGKHPAPPPACNEPELQTGWDHVLACFAGKHGKASCQSWLSGTAVTGAEIEGNGATVLISCPNRFIRQWLEQHYLADMQLWWSEHRFQSQRITGVRLLTQEAGS
jgi:hypothetical protein